MVTNVQICLPDSSSKQVKERNFEDTPITILTTGHQMTILSKHNKVKLQPTAVKNSHK